VEIQIDDKLLSEFQRGKIEERGLSNANLSARSLMLDLVNSPGSCYLLSGYRGAGKTTYIKLVEMLSKEAPAKKMVFVHVDLSRYKEKGNLFRWLIRELYLSISETSSYTALKIEEAQKPLIQQATRLLEELHEKTFAETTGTRSKRTEVTRTFESTFNLLTWINLIVSSISTVFLSLNLAFGWISTVTLSP